MAAATDLLLSVGDPGSATTLNANYTIADPSITVVSTTNWTATGVGVIFAIDEATIIDGEEVQTAGTYNEFEGTVASATSVTNVAWQRGSGNRNYTAGSLTRVYIPVSSERENRLVEWGSAEHNVSDGTHSAVTADTIVIADAGTLDVDTINEATAAAGVTVDGLLIKDGYPTQASKSALTTDSNPYKFSAYRSSAWTIGTGAALITFNSELYDTNSNYDISTGKYTAPVDGFYWFHAGIGFVGAGGSNNYGSITIRVNGANVQNIQSWQDTPLAVGYGPVGSAFLQLAATDYVQIYCNNATSVAGSTSSVSVFFKGFLVSRT